MKAVLIIIVLFIILPALGQDGVRFSGTLEKDTYWSDIVFVEGDLYVKPGVTLTIAPGTRVLFKSNVRGYDKGIGLYVRGNLIAKGQKGTGQIVFTSAANQPRPHDWFGIVMNGVRSPSLMQYCVVEYAYNGISCANSTVLIDNCTLRFNQYAGISCEFSSNPLIQHTALLSNGFAGIVCELRSNPVIQFCHILLNANGLVASDKSAPDLGRAAPLPEQSAGFNHIYNNRQFNIYHHSGADIYAQNNYWNQIAREQILPTIDDGINSDKYGRVLFDPFVQEEAMLASAETLRIPASALLRPPVAQSAGAVSPRREGRVAAEVMPPKRDLSVPPLSPEAGELPRKPPDRSGRNVEKPPVSAAGTALPSPADENAVAAPGGLDDPATPAAASRGSEAPAKPAAVPGVGADGTVAKPADRDPANPDSIETPAGRPSAVAAGVEGNPAAAGDKAPLLPGDLSIYPEALLDGGQREYLRKINPEYPRIHLKSANEGVVLIEVTVGRDGRIESYRVLRSDGSAFQEAAERALRQYRYKPGKIHNRAVKFQVVERFEFILD